VTQVQLGSCVAAPRIQAGEASTRAAVRVVAWWSPFLPLDLQPPERSGAHVWDLRHPVAEFSSGCGLAELLSRAGEDCRCARDLHAPANRFAFFAQLGPLPATNAGDRNSCWRAGHRHQEVRPCAVHAAHIGLQAPTAGHRRAQGSERVSFEHVLDRRQIRNRCFTVTHGVHSRLGAQGVTPTFAQTAHAGREQADLLQAAPACRRPSERGHGVRHPPAPPR